MHYWLIKSEPDVYSWHDLERDGQTSWDGVRNYQARNNLSAMRTGDHALFYHSTIGKEVVGIAEIVREAYPDPTSEDLRWFTVDIKPFRALSQPVSLAAIKAEPRLANIGLLRQSQLSVVALNADEFEILCGLGGIHYTMK